MGNLREAIAEYAAIVEGTREEYTQEELTVSIIRQDHPELDFMDDDEIQEIIDFANRGREKWYVVIETQADGKNYVGINDDSYCGDNIISEHDSEDEADAACIKYAQEQLTLFADYQYSSVNERVKYTFEIYLKEQARAIWLSPQNYSEQELKDKCYADYLKYCKEHHMETEKAQPASRA